MANPRMNMYVPDEVSPPGETLAELLEDRAMTQADLAERTGRSKKTINEIIRGKAAITPETAIQLERVLGVPVHFWLAREQHYSEFLARRQDAQQLAEQVDWLDEIPVRSIVQAGWMEARTEPVAQLREALAFYGIAAPAQYEVLTAVFRRSAALQSDQSAVAAWLRQGERLAHELQCAQFDEQGFRVVLSQARALTRAPFDRVRAELPRLCAQVGVAVVIVPELPRTRLCGSTRWLTPTKALIQLSLRYKTDDQFWFTFFHEAGHILLHGKRAAFLDEDALVKNQREDEANTFARDTLIPASDMQRLLSQQPRGSFTADMITQFAADLGVAPGIVVGRLQHDSLVPKSNLNKLKQRIAA